MRRIRPTHALDLASFERIAGEDGFPVTPIELSHVYVKLDFKPEYECAKTADDAKRFLRSVARAAMAADLLASEDDGHVLEIQGSMLHVGLPLSAAAASTYAIDLHHAFRLLFNDPSSRVSGWRTTFDAGRTLVVAGLGVHGDRSLVSLGNSANRPAKHLYAQMELPSERERDLKCFHLGMYDPRTGHWRHESMEDAKPVRLDKAKFSAEEARRAEPELHFSRAGAGLQMIKADAAPLAPAGSPSSPSPDTPSTYFGWVMRADLDGFTARVEECFGDDGELIELASRFYQIMDAASEFVDLHRETLVQLPWAGDNFTAAAVFRNKSEYDHAVSTRLVELSLDYDKELGELATQSGFGGWAHGVAGGDIHGNSSGNVYVAGIEVRGRRFLVGAGEGFGRSAQAFGDINPRASELVIYSADYSRLSDTYKSVFRPATTRRDKESTLYRSASTKALVVARSRKASVKVVTPVTLPGGKSHHVTARPYSR